MADVFTGIPIEMHTGQGPGTLAWLRGKYGTRVRAEVDLTHYRIAQIWEVSQQRTMIIRFWDQYGDPVIGLKATMNYYGNVVPVVSNENGEIHWVVNIEDASFDRRTEEGPFTLITDDGGLKIVGLGTPMKNATINHDMLCFTVIVGAGSPVVIPPIVPPSPGNPGVTMADLDRLSAAFTRIKGEAEHELSFLQRLRNNEP